MILIENTIYLTLWYSKIWNEIDYSDIYIRLLTAYFELPIISLEPTDDPGSVL